MIRPGPFPGGNFLGSDGIVTHRSQTGYSGDSACFGGPRIHTVFSEDKINIVFTSFSKLVILKAPAI